MVGFRVPGLSSSLLVGCLTLVACEKRAPTVTRSAPIPTATAATNDPTLVHPTVRVEITGEGFAPARVFIEATQPLVFRRTTNESCATALVFPEFGIERALPLNTDVPVPLPATAAGELAFQCGVGKQRGKLMARLAGG